MRTKSLTYIGGNDELKAIEFVKVLRNEIKIDFHPDDPAECYINIETREKTFNQEETKALDKSRKLLFKHFGERVYHLCLVASGHRNMDGSIA